MTCRRRRSDARLMQPALRPRTTGLSTLGRSNRGCVKMVADLFIAAPLDRRVQLVSRLVGIPDQIGENPEDRVLVFFVEIAESLSHFTKCDHGKSGRLHHCLI